MGTDTKATKKSTIKTMKLDPKLINDPELLKQWDQIWSTVNESRVRLNFARQTQQTITVEMMHSYEQARNAERQFFWDQFYEKSDSQ